MVQPEDRSDALPYRPTKNVSMTITNIFKRFFPHLFGPYKLPDYITLNSVTSLHSFVLFPLASYTQ